jgi:hypothetical protein
MDDRVNKALRDQLEKERRLASAASVPLSPTPSAPPKVEEMPGTGHTLGGDPLPCADDENP